MHDKDPFQSYAPTMRGKQYSDQREPPPLRLSSTSSTSCLRSTILQIKWCTDTLQNGAPTTQNILLMQVVMINATAITTHPPLFGSQLVCCSISFAVDPLDVVTV